MIPRKLFGMALAVAGMTAYGHAAVQHNADARRKKQKQLREADVDVYAKVLVPGGAGEQSGALLETSRGPGKEVGRVVGGDAGGAGGLTHRRAQQQR